MNIKNCSVCGKVYTGSHQNLCPDCAEADEEEFAKVRLFIKENPKVSIEVVAEATEVDEEKIREYLRKGRIDLADLEGPILECSRCGKPIYQGEYCVNCQSEISNVFKGAGSQNDAKGRHISFKERYGKD